MKGKNSKQYESVAQVSNFSTNFTMKTLQLEHWLEMEGKTTHLEFEPFFRYRYCPVFEFICLFSLERK